MSVSLFNEVRNPCVEIVQRHNLHGFPSRMYIDMTGRPREVQTGRLTHDGGLSRLVLSSVDAGSNCKCEGSLASGSGAEISLSEIFTNQTETVTEQAPPKPPPYQTQVKQLSRRRINRQ